MKILLAGIAAKFIHQNLAVDVLALYARQRYGLRCHVAEFTINQSFDLILGELYRQKPDLLGFSCYIWNWELVRRLVKALRKILPETKILLGGPEVSYDAQEALADPGADFVLSGEGEEPFAWLCLALRDGLPLEKVPSLTWRKEGGIIQNPSALPLDLSRLPFPVENFSRYENRILYYEAQRGCPFRCQYCLSSGEGLRLQPLPKVLEELQRYLDAGAAQVKLVDRTFNADAAFAMAIWRYLAARDNGVTNFHFEIEAGLLTPEELDFLKTVRPGLFQFEIGIQSTNPATLAAACRREDFPQAARAVRALQEAGNIHLHLDLIAGLPYEGFERFGESFDQVYALEPAQLQLGFLKLLRGSGLRRDAGRYGIRWQDQAPYEVLETGDLSFGELLLLKDVEELVDRYCNSGRFRAGLRELVGLAPSPFAFYTGFAAFCRERGALLQPLAMTEQYSLLREYGLTLADCSPERLGWLLEYDLCTHEKPRKRPDWMPVSDDPARREWSYRFLRDPEKRRTFLPSYEGMEDLRVFRLVQIGFFPLDPRTGEDGECVLLFDYRETGPSGSARVSRID